MKTTATATVTLQMNVPCRLRFHQMNRDPSNAFKGKSPLEIIGKKLNLSYLRAFGCTCYFHLEENQRHKLEVRTAKCIFMGYPHQKKGYKCYNATDEKVYFSRDVRFLEHQPFYAPSETDFFNRIRNLKEDHQTIDN